MADIGRTRGEIVGSIVSALSWPLAAIGIFAPSLAMTRTGMLAAVCTLLLGFGLRKTRPFANRDAQSLLGAISIVGTVVMGSLASAFALSTIATLPLVAFGLMPDGDDQPLRHGLSVWLVMTIVFVVARNRWAGSPKTGGFIDWLR